MDARWGEDVPETRESILVDMEREIEEAVAAAVTKARRRLLALSSDPAPRREPLDASEPTPGD